VSPEPASGAESSAYRPYTNTRRPGGPPDYQPRYRVVVHRQHESRWVELADRIGLAQAQKFYDHVAQTPGTPAAGIKLDFLRGGAGRAQDGFSRVMHWRVPGSAARIDYSFNDAFTGGSNGDPHPVVRVEAVKFSSH
jgi:hypothetical protein